MLDHMYSCHNCPKIRKDVCSCWVLCVLNTMVVHWGHGPLCMYCTVHCGTQKGICMGFGQVFGMSTEVVVVVVATDVDWVLVLHFHFETAHVKASWDHHEGYSTHHVSPNSVAVYVLYWVW